MWSNLSYFKRGKCKRFYDAMEVFAIELFEKKVPNNLQIIVKFTDCRVNGDCGIGDYEDEFEIRIDRDLDDETQLVTLAHEMVHVRQRWTGEFREGERGYDIWHGKKIYSKVTTLKEEHNLPWEKEAYKLEKKLYKKFREIENGRS